MITIEISVYKRGYFNFKYNLEFNSEQELINYINSKKEFTKECIEEENEIGENIYPFRERFIFNKVDYSFYADA